MQCVLGLIYIVGLRVIENRERERETRLKSKQIRNCEGKGTGNAPKEKGKGPGEYKDDRGEKQSKKMKHINT